MRSGRALGWLQSDAAELHLDRRVSMRFPRSANPPDYPVLRANRHGGSTVRWRNQGAAQHTATAFNRSFDSKLLGRNAGYARKFSRPGTYAYLCALHPQMTGKVIVR